MLNFEQKLAIVESFAELQRKEVSLGRMNFHYENSDYDKKIVVYHLHPNGNGFVYAGQLKGFQKDDKGFVNIRDYSEDDLRSLIEQSIRSLTSKSTEKQVAKANNEKQERWTGADDQLLTLSFEEDLWYVYAGPNLDCAFETYEEAVEYLQEEGFTRT
jgi:hypothetical protein